MPIPINLITLLRTAKPHDNLEGIGLFDCILRAFCFPSRILHCAILVRCSMVTILWFNIFTSTLQCVTNIHVPSTARFHLDHFPSNYSSPELQSLLSRLWQSGFQQTVMILFHRLVPYVLELSFPYPQRPDCFCARNDRLKLGGEICRWLDLLSNLRGTLQLVAAFQLVVTRACFRSPYAFSHR